MRDPEYRLWYRFNLTMERYNQILESQGFVCALCKQPCGTGRAMAVDHDRECCPGRPIQERTCGKCIRGLVCMSCNIMLGKIEKTITLARVVEYLRSSPSHPKESL